MTTTSVSVLWLTISQHQPHFLSSNYMGSSEWSHFFLWVFACTSLTWMIEWMSDGLRSLYISHDGFQSHCHHLSSFCDFICATCHGEGRWEYHWDSGGKLWRLILELIIKSIIYKVLGNVVDKENSHLPPTSPAHHGTSICSLRLIIDHLWTWLS